MKSDWNQRPNGVRRLAVFRNTNAKRFQTHHKSFLNRTLCEWDTLNNALSNTYVSCTLLTSPRAPRWTGSVIIDTFRTTEESTSIKVRYAKINYTREFILLLCSLQTNKRLFQLWRNRDCRRRQTLQRRCEGRKLIINIIRDDSWCVARSVRSQHCRHIESVVFNLLFLSAHINAFHVSILARRSS